MYASRFLASASVAALLLLLGAPVSQAATPAAGTVSESQPTATWAGSYTPPLAAVGCSGPNDSNCDNFRLTVAPPPHPFNVQITLHVTTGDDWDLKVYDPAGNVVATSGNGGGQDEVAVLTDPAAGTYTVQAVNFSGVQPTFGVATLAARSNDAPPPGAGPAPTYSIFADPNEHSSGEPSVGVSWR